MKYGIHGEFDETPNEQYDDEVKFKSVRAASPGRDEGATMATSDNPVPDPSSPIPHHNNTHNTSKSEAVVFSIQFYGKTIGEVGLMDQDLSELDWKKFKSYLFQNLLSMNHQENICVSYSDDEGDKLPIESEEEYREALKVAKKKAEAHDKLVLDITRQGSLPTVLSLVSSGIKRVSSSPPKEGGISFFKASSFPKETLGFTGRMKTSGPERKLLPTFLSSEKSDGVSENGGGARARAREVHVERPSQDLPPQWFTAYMTKFREEMSQQVALKVTEMLQENHRAPLASVHPLLPEDPINDLEMKFSRCSLVSQGAYSNSQLKCSLRETTGTFISNLQTSNCDSKGVKKGKVEVSSPVQNSGCAVVCDNKGKKKGKVEDVSNLLHKSSSSIKIKKVNENTDTSDTGTKRKKATREEERLSRKQEKLEERLARIGEKYSKMQEKLEEKHIKKQEKIAERLHKQQEKTDRKKPTCKYPEEMDRTSRTQEKVLAKMEGLRKKQSCSPEELNKLRKMVDKQHRVITAEQRQQRRNDRKAGNWKAGKAKKVSIDNKAFPVDASLLHAALQELEALAEDSPTEGAYVATQGYDALYVKDITYPDGSEVAPGAEFVKTWRVANSGVWTWNEKTTLCKWTQVRFRGSPAGWKLKPALKKIVCPALEPGQESDISITFTAPSEPGWYATHWRFCQRGRVFGNQMWCAVHVVDNPNSSAVLATSLERSDREKCPEGGLETLKASQGQIPQGKHDLSDDTNGEPVSAVRVPGIETRGILSSPSPDHLLTDQAEYEFGIVEDYYDAEDPVSHQLMQSEPCLTPLRQEERPLADGHEEPDLDLISFEEDAELVASGSSTPEIIASPPGAKSVIPLKDIARESVESLREALSVKAGGNSEKPASRTCYIDVMSDSSGSVSELDSEDQAILNESDTETSDYEYYIVHIPECFDVTQKCLNRNEVALQDLNNEETERPESPDFLTADEDDRTTTIACSSPHNQQVSTTGNGGDSTLTESSCISSHSHTVRVISLSDIAERGSGQSAEGFRGIAIKSALPLPPPEAKGFMEIPAEALKANLAYSIQQEATAAAGTSGSESPSPQQDHTRATWKSGAQHLSGVVCEQPLSAQIQCKQVAGSRTEGASGVNRVGSGAGDVAGVDQVTALPDELVSIIPEDLVRGVWNTARTFITRINQEMLSPSANSRGIISDKKDEPASEDQCPPSEECHEPEETTQSSAAAPECEREMPLLPPPLQQLADMGFTNHEVNQRLLTKYNNDVACAVAELIVLNCQ